MRHQRLTESRGQHGSPIVAEMTGNASIDEVDFGNPDLLDAALKRIGLLDSSVFLKGCTKISLNRPPRRKGFAPQRDSDQREEDERHCHEPSVVGRFVRLLVLLHRASKHAGIFRAWRAGQINFPIRPAQKDADNDQDDDRDNRPGKDAILVAAGAREPSALGAFWRAIKPMATSPARAAKIPASGYHRGSRR